MASNEPSPPRRVVVEDLDRLENRRRKEREKLGWRQLFTRDDSPEAGIYRELFGYTRPHRALLFAALLMAVASGFGRAVSVLVLERVLAPIVDDPQPGSGMRVLGELLASAAGPWLGGDGLADLLSRAATLRAGLGAWWSTYTRGEQLHIAISSFVLIVLGTELINYMRRLASRTVSLDIVRRLRADVFDRLLLFSLRFYHKNPSGRLLSRVTNDLSNLGGVLVDILTIYLPDVFTIAWLVALLLAKTGPMMLVALLIGGISFLPAQAIARRLRRKERDNQRKMSNVVQVIGEVLQAQKIVKAFGGEDHERARFGRINDDWTRNRMKIAALKARTGPLMQLVGTVGVAALLWYGGQRVIDGEVDGSEFMVIIFMIVQIISALRRLGETATKLQSALASADRVATLMHCEPEIVDAPGAAELTTVREGIEFENVGYSYDAEHPVLRAITLRVPKGASVAIVGPTGSGKSTIADLVPRFFDPDEGVVRIDGRDVRDYTLASLRRNVAMVTQDTLLFRDTVAANIAYALPDTPMDRIVEAARAAHAHEFIERMPQGYDTLVGERGQTLSGGERQRVAIARALLRDAPILILDEATSALDSHSEKIVQSALDRLKQGRTTITIAHRLSTVRDCDMIFVIDRGEILEQGTPGQLLQRGGLYARLHAMQTGKT